MKITDRLIGDHKTFRRMMADLDGISDLPPQQWELKKIIRLVELFKDHLILHAWFEDQFYYPAISAALVHKPLPPLDKRYMEHLDHEHKTIDGYMNTLEQEVIGKPLVRTWPQTYALFFHGLKAHMKKEEEELFPLSEQLLGGERLEQLSLEMEQHRSEAPKIRLHTRV